MRAIGPELTRYGVPNALANPTLELHDSTGALIATNDNWQHYDNRRDYHERPSASKSRTAATLRETKGVSNHRRLPAR